MRGVGNQPIRRLIVGLYLALIAHDPLCYPLVCNELCTLVRVHTFKWSHRLIRGTPAMTQPNYRLRGILPTFLRSVNYHIASLLWSRVQHPPSPLLPRYPIYLLKLRQIQRRERERNTILLIKYSMNSGTRQQSILTLFNLNPTKKLKQSYLRTSLLIPRHLTTSPSSLPPI